MQTIHGCGQELADNVNFLNFYDVLCCKNLFKLKKVWQKIVYATKMSPQESCKFGVKSKSYCVPDIKMEFWVVCVK